MSKNKRFTVKLKRKRSKKTNYLKRISYLKSGSIRLVIRPSLNNIIVQLIEYNPKGDKVLLTTTSKELKNFDWKYHLGSIPSSYLTGLLCGVKAKKKNIKNAILDIGLNKSVGKTRIYAALKGVIDTGIKIYHSPEILPDEKTLSGEKIALYSKYLSNNKEGYSKQFSYYIRNKINPEEIQDKFSQVKERITK